MSKQQSRKATVKYIPGEGQQSDERFIAVVNELIRVKDEHFAPVLRWFSRHANRPRVMFQISGILLIILSVSVPLLGVLEGVWRDIVLPIAALVIAALTGLNSFFQWQKSWQGRRQTQFALEYLLSKWDLDMTIAKHHSDPEKAIEMAVKATGQLLDRAREITSSETAEYFQGLQLPRVVSGDE